MLQAIVFLVLARAVVVDQGVALTRSSKANSSRSHYQTGQAVDEQLNSIFISFASSPHLEKLRAANGTNVVINL